MAMTCFALASRAAAVSATTPAKENPPESDAARVDYGQRAEEGEGVAVIFCLLLWTDVLTGHAVAEAGTAWVVYERGDICELEAFRHFRYEHFLYTCKLRGRYFSFGLVTLDLKRAHPGREYDGRSSRFGRVKPSSERESIESLELYVFVVRHRCSVGTWERLERVIDSDFSAGPCVF